MAWAEAEALFGLAQTGAEEGVWDGGMGKLPGMMEVFMSIFFR